MNLKSCSINFIKNIQTISYYSGQNCFTEEQRGNIMIKTQVVLSPEAVPSYHLRLFKIGSLLNKSKILQLRSPSPRGFGGRRKQTLLSRYAEWMSPTYNPAGTKAMIAPPTRPPTSIKRLDILPRYFRESVLFRAICKFLLKTTTVYVH